MFAFISSNFDALSQIWKVPLGPRDVVDYFFARATGTLSTLASSQHLLNSMALGAFLD